MVDTAYPLLSAVSLVDASPSCAAHRPTIQAAFDPSPAAPRSDEHPLGSYLRMLHRKHADCMDGAVASYIPELTKADPRWFGIAVATIDGNVYEVGDTAQPFTIQSMSKPFVYGLALQDLADRGQRAKAHATHLSRLEQ